MNLRPPGPQPGALPDCATPRDGDQSTRSREHGCVRTRCEHVFVSPEHIRRVCGRCGAWKPIDEFAWRRKHKGQRDNYCRACRADYNREHYLANKQRYVDQARAQMQRLAVERHRYLLEYFGANPCADCGETNPLVLEFDHLRDKCFNIGSALPYRNWKSILAEIEKCEVVCANCHRVRTAIRMGSNRAVLVAAALKRTAGIEPAP